MIGKMRFAALLLTWLLILIACGEFTTPDGGGIADIAAKPGKRSGLDPSQRQVAIDIDKAKETARHGEEKATESKGNAQSTNNIADKYAHRADRINDEVSKHPYDDEYFEPLDEYYMENGGTTFAEELELVMEAGEAFADAVEYSSELADEDKSDIVTAIGEAFRDLQSAAETPPPDTETWSELDESQKDVVKGTDFARREAQEGKNAASGGLPDKAQIGTHADGYADQSHRVKGEVSESDRDQAYYDKINDHYTEDGKVSLTDQLLLAAEDGKAFAQAVKDSPDLSESDKDELIAVIVIAIDDIRGSVEIARSPYVGTWLNCEYDALQKASWFTVYPDHTYVTYWTSGDADPAEVSVMNTVSLQDAGTYLVETIYYDALIRISVDEDQNRVLEVVHGFSEVPQEIDPTDPAYGIYYYFDGDHVPPCGET